MRARTQALRPLLAAGLTLLACAIARGQPANTPTNSRANAPAATLPGLPPAPVFDPRNPPEGVFLDEWTVIDMGGKKVGYTHEVYRRQGDRILTHSLTAYTLLRLNQPMQITETATTEETVAGELRAFKDIVTQGDATETVTGSGDGRIFEVTKQTPNAQEHQRVVLPPGTVFGWGEERLQRIHGFAPNTKYEVMTYAPGDDYLKAIPKQVTVDARDNVRVGQTDVVATRVLTHLGAPASATGMEAISWVDDHGRTLKFSMPLGPQGGMTLESTAATEAEALAQFVPADIFTSSLIPLSNAPSANATSVTYQLKRRDGQPLPAAPDSLTQHTEQLPGGAVRLTLTRGAAPSPTHASAPKFDAAPYLARNSFLDTNDPNIKRLAAEGGGPAGTAPTQVAARLRDFVAKYINKKDYSVGFATASTVAKDREGDCTEHAVLLAALGRARGLPARIVSGLAFEPKDATHPDLLGYHMWAQFYLDGQWVDYDAALPELPGPPRRLGLMASDLDNDSLADLTLGMLGWMADLDVQIVR